MAWGARTVRRWGWTTIRLLAGYVRGAALWCGRAGLQAGGVLLILAMLSGPVVADNHAAARLLAAMRMDDTLDLLRDEGLAYAATLGEEMLPGGNDVIWQGLAERIYDIDRMTSIVADAFGTAFTAEAAPLIGYFEGGDGRQILSVELSARRAFLDKQIEDAARAAWAATPDDDLRQRQITEYIVVNDLLESNVAGALNSNLMFYRGLSEGGAMALSETEMLQEVWTQEDTLREDIRGWLHAYLTMAYGGVSDSTLDGYIALSQTPEGQVLNRALFAAFNRMHDEISYALGLALASRMAPGEDL